MKTSNIAKFMVREIGHAVLQATRHQDRKIVGALFKHSDGFHLSFDINALSFDINADLSCCYFRFTFYNNTSVELKDVDTEFQYVMALSNDAFVSLKAAIVEALGKIWYVKDELNDETESVGDLLERESAVIDSIAVGRNGYLSLEFANHPDSTIESDINHILEAYIPEDLL